MFKVQRVFRLNLYKVKQIPNLKIMNDLVHSSATCFFPFNNMPGPSLPTCEQVDSFPLQYAVLCRDVSLLLNILFFCFSALGKWPRVLELSYCQLHAEEWGGWLEYVQLSLSKSLPHTFQEVLGVFYEQYKRTT